MASNSWGKHFRLTTFGESHGDGIGGVIDGCPSGMHLDIQRIQKALERRRPGWRTGTSPRKEQDHINILSGLYQGKTTGAPIGLWIKNQDVQSKEYNEVAHIYKPGHAQYSYLKKYGIYDHRGGGRASARETAIRVAAGSIAEQCMPEICVTAYIQQIHTIQCAEIDLQYLSNSALFCPDPAAEHKIIQLLEQEEQMGDSVGALIGCRVDGVPAGWGEPIYEKLEAELAHAIMTIPATRGITFGVGIQAVSMHGSEHNDNYTLDGSSVTFSTNRHGGIQGGISTGMPIEFQVIIKPTSSIKKEQNSVCAKTHTKTTFKLPATSRHDACIGIRAVPVIEAMTRLVLMNAKLAHTAQKSSCF